MDFTAQCLYKLSQLDNFKITGSYGTLVIEAYGTSFDTASYNIEEGLFAALVTLSAQGEFKRLLKLEREEMKKFKAKEES